MAVISMSSIMDHSAGHWQAMASAGSEEICSRHSLCRFSGRVGRKFRSAQVVADVHAVGDRLVDDVTSELRNGQVDLRKRIEQRLLIRCVVYE